MLLSGGVQGTGNEPPNAALDQDDTWTSAENQASLTKDGGHDYVSMTAKRS